MDLQINSESKFRTNKNKEKKVRLTVKEKSQLIIRMRRGETLSKLAEEFGIGKSTAHDIYKNRDKILTYLCESNNNPIKRKSLKPPKYGEVEKALYSWYTQESILRSVTGPQLRSKARSLYEELTGKKDFAGSNGWLDNFKNRYSIRFSTDPKDIDLLGHQDADEINELVSKMNEECCPAILAHQHGIEVDKTLEEGDEDKLNLCSSRNIKKDVKGRNHTTNRIPYNMSKRKIKTLTIKDKCTIIDRIENGEDSDMLFKEYGIGKSTMYGILQKRRHYRQKITNNDRKRLRPAKYPIVEDAVFQWYLQQRSQGQVTGPMILEKAKEFYGQITGKNDFVGSNGWLVGFKNRHGIRFRPDSNQCQLQNEIKLEEETANDTSDMPDELHKQSSTDCGTVQKVISKTCDMGDSIDNAVSANENNYDMETNLQNTESTHNRKNNITISKKSEIIDRLDSGEKPKKLAKEYGISRSTIFAIQQNRISIKNYLATSNNCKRKRLKKPINLEVDKAVLKWYLSQKEKGVHVNGKMIVKQAKLIHKILNGCSDFSASPGWLHRFKIRHGIKLKRKIAEESQVEITEGNVTDFDIKEEIKSNDADDDYDTTNYEDIISPLKSETELEFVDTLSSTPNVSPEEAVRSFETCLLWAEQNYLSTSEIELLRSMRDKALMCDSKVVKQEDVDELMS